MLSTCSCYCSTPPAWPLTRTHRFVYAQVKLPLCSHWLPDALQTLFAFWNSYSLKVPEASVLCLHWGRGVGEVWGSPTVISIVP